MLMMCALLSRCSRSFGPPSEWKSKTERLMTHLSNEDLENSRFDQRLNLWFGVLKIGITWVTLTVNVGAPSSLVSPDSNTWCWRGESKILAFQEQCEACPAVKFLATRHIQHWFISVHTVT
jgi:hypothetical protein